MLKAWSEGLCVQYNIINQIIKLAFCHLYSVKKIYGKNASRFYSMMQCIVCTQALPQSL